MRLVSFLLFLFDSNYQAWSTFYWPSFSQLVMGKAGSLRICPGVALGQSLWSMKTCAVVGTWRRLCF